MLMFVVASDLSEVESSIDNPSLHVSGHVSVMNRCFIVEDNAEDDFGQRARDEVTCEQDYVMTRDHVCDTDARS